MALFQKRAGEENADDRTRRTGYVPASMRERPAPPVLSTEELEDEHDEEIVFLSNLAGEVDRAPARDASSDDEATRRSGDDEMWAFREYSLRIEQNEGVRRHVTQDVEISDLLDDLKGTAAALRRRRAA
jgi:hypothetical protein